MADKQEVACLQIAVCTVNEKGKDVPCLVGLFDDGSIRSTLLVPNQHGQRQWYVITKPCD